MLCPGGDGKPLEVSELGHTQSDLGCRRSTQVRGRKAISQQVNPTWGDECCGRGQTGALQKLREEGDQSEALAKANGS